MRIFFVVGIAVAVAASSTMMPTLAQGGGYPFCIKGDSYDSPVGDCAFLTYSQCMAAASGHLAYCDVNPHYAEPKPGGVTPKKR